MYESIRVVALTEVDAGTFEALVEHTRTNGFASWDSAVAAVWLHGSVDVVVTVTELDEMVGRLFYVAVGPKITTVPQWETGRRPAGRAFERFVCAAREELDLPPVPVRVFTDPLAIERTGRDDAGHVDAPADEG